MSETNNPNSEGRLLPAFSKEQASEFLAAQSKQEFAASNEKVETDTGQMPPRPFCPASRPLSQEETDSSSSEQEEDMAATTDEALEPGREEANAPRTDTFHSAETSIIPVPEEEIIHFASPEKVQKETSALEPLTEEPVSPDGDPDTSQTENHGLPTVNTDVIEQAAVPDPFVLKEKSVKNEKDMPEPAPDERTDKTSCEPDKTVPSSREADQMDESSRVENLPDLNTPLLRVTIKREGSEAETNVQTPPCFFTDSPALSAFDEEDSDGLPADLERLSAVADVVWPFDNEEQQPGLLDNGFPTPTPFENTGADILTSVDAEAERQQAMLAIDPESVNADDEHPDDLWDEDLWGEDEEEDWQNNLDDWDEEDDEDDWEDEDGRTLAGAVFWALLILTAFFAGCTLTKAWLEDDILSRPAVAPTVEELSVEKEAASIPEPEVTQAASGDLLDQARGAFARGEYDRSFTLYHRLSVTGRALLDSTFFQAESAQIAPLCEWQKEGMLEGTRLEPGSDVFMEGLVISAFSSQNSIDMYVCVNNDYVHPLLLRFTDLNPSDIPPVGTVVRWTGRRLEDFTPDKKTGDTGTYVAMHALRYWFLSAQ